MQMILMLFKIENQISQTSFGYETCFSLKSEPTLRVYKDFTPSSYEELPSKEDSTKAVSSEDNNSFYSRANVSETTV